MDTSFLLLKTVNDHAYYTTESAVRGVQIYKDVWVPVLHEVLQTEQEFGNEKDQHAVAVIKSVCTVEFDYGQ